MINNKVELHLHLDGSLNLMWSFNKAKELNVIDKEMSFEEYYRIMFSRNMGHSAETIKKFDILCDLLQREQDIFEASYNLVKHLEQIGVMYAEIRFAPQQHLKQGLSQLEVLKNVIDGANKACLEGNIKVFVISCLMHKGDSADYNYKENLETIEASKQLLHAGVVGIDLAGYENNCEYKDYLNVIKIVKEYNIPLTMHAGEMGIASHIIDAIDMGADRIGHGVNCVNDEKILERVVKRQIPLEVCVSSNVKPDYNYATHPIRKLIEAGAYITINSDNMIFAKTDINNEFNQLHMLGISDEQLKQFTLNAINASFADDKTKDELRRRLNETN